jgi:transcriptional regulator with XRE-family HTH domain
LNQLLPLPADNPPNHGLVLSRTLRALRRRRGLLMREVAAKMGMRFRTYQLFEAGGGKLNLSRIQQFADATDTDAWAILVSLAFGSPQFALLCADNKLMTAAVESVRDFHRDWGEDIAKLDPRLVMHELDAAWRRLGLEGRDRRFPSSGPPAGPSSNLE